MISELKGQANDCKAKTEPNDPGKARATRTTRGGRRKKNKIKLIDMKQRTKSPKEINGQTIRIIDTAAGLDRNGDHIGITDQAVKLQREYLANLAAIQDEENPGADTRDENARYTRRQYAGY